MSAAERLAKPVELDIAVGAHGDRAVYRLECMAHVDPRWFVATVQEFVASLLDGTPVDFIGRSPSGPQSPSTGGEDSESTSETGSVVEPAAAPASRSRGAGAKAGKVTKLDHDALRAQAAAAC